jgi:hypothetical protein
VPGGEPARAVEVPGSGAVVRRPTTALRSGVENQGSSISRGPTLRSSSAVTAVLVAVLDESPRADQPAPNAVSGALPLSRRSSQSSGLTASQPSCSPWSTGPSFGASFIASPQLATPRVRGSPARHCTTRQTRRCDEIRGPGPIRPVFPLTRHRPAVAEFNRRKEAVKSLRSGLPASVTSTKGLSARGGPNGRQRPTGQWGDDQAPARPLLPRLVGVTGFEPATSSSRTTRATKLRHTPWPLSLGESSPSPAHHLHPFRVRSASSRWPPGGTRNGWGQTARCPDRRRRATSWCGRPRCAGRGL